MPETGNLFDALETARESESFTDILTRPGIRIERIVSHGQATPPDEPMVQAHDEWVILLSGTAGLRLQGEDERTLKPGDYCWIPRGIQHWVTWTDPDQPSLWLAVHLD